MKKKFEKIVYSINPKLLLVFLLVLLFGAYMHTFAIGSPYQPGAMLDPACAPTEDNCFVQIIPDQTGHSGQFLTTNGSITSWAAGGGGGSQNLQQVTDIGNTTTTNMYVNSGGFLTGIQNGSVLVSNNSDGGGVGFFTSGSLNSGYIQFANSNGANGRILAENIDAENTPWLQFPDFDGTHTIPVSINSDFFADSAGDISLGISDILNVGQVFAASRAMDIGTSAYTITSATYPSGLLYFQDFLGFWSIGDHGEDVNGTNIVGNDANQRIQYIAANGHEFIGSIKIIDGTQADGYVLTSDADGNATWQAPSGGGGTPGGSNRQMQFNDSGAFGGATDGVIIPESLLGQEEMNNGDFNGDAEPWKVNNYTHPLPYDGWSYNSNNIIHDGTGAHTGYVYGYSTASLMVGVAYTVTFDIGGTTGTVDVRLGSESTPHVFNAGDGSVSFVGHYGFDISAAIRFIPSADFDGTIDSVSVKALKSQYGFGYGSFTMPSASVSINSHGTDYALDVLGSVKIADGTQQAGYVFTSDGDGNATWQAPSGGGGWGTTGTVSTLTGSASLDQAGNNFSFSNGNVLMGTGSPTGAQLDVFYGLGGEQIGNGDFNGDATGWKVYFNQALPFDGWSYNSNDVIHDGSGGHTALLYQPGSLIAGVPYVVTFDIGGSTGTVLAQLGGGTGQTFNAGDGSVTFTGYYINNILSSIFFAPSDDFDGTITNVSVKQKNPSINTSGSIRIADGTQGAGYVFTSDANGLGSWQAPGGTTLFSLNGTNTATGDITGDLDGNVLNVVSGGNSFLTIDPTVDNETSMFGAYNITDDGNTSQFYAGTSNTYASFEIFAAFNDGVKQVDISGFTDATTSTINSEADTWTHTGNFGIGATPTADQLFVVSNGVGSNLINIDKTNFDSAMIATDNTATTRLELSGNSTSPLVFAALSSDDGIGNSLMNITSDSSNGYTFQIDTYDGTNSVIIFGDAVANTLTLTAANHIFNGAVQFADYGSGPAVFDASGNITSASDERLKDIQGDYSAGLAEILNLTPILYKWNALSKLETEHVYAGFSAQNVQQFIPYGTGENKNGYLSLQDRAITAALVNAVKEMNIKIVGLSSLDTTDANSLGSLIKSFLGSIENQISDLYATIIHSDRIETKTLCVGNTCVTEEQFLHMVQQSGTQSSGGGGGGTVEPPAPTDLCPNIDGDQSTIPTGYHADETNNCIADENPDSTPPPESPPDPAPTPEEPPSDTGDSSTPAPDTTPTP